MTPTPASPAQSGQPETGLLAHHEVVACASRLLAAQASTLSTAVDQALALLAEKLRAQRVCVLMVSHDGERLSCFRAHSTPGLPPLREQLQGVPAAEWPWTLPRLRAQRAVEVRSLLDLPDEAAVERRALEAAGVNSAIFLPIGGAGVWLGMLALQWVAQEGRWMPPDVVQLCFLGQVLGAVLDRDRLAEQARQSNRRLQSFVDGSRAPTCCFEIPGGIPVHAHIPEQWRMFAQQGVVAESNDLFARLCGATAPAEIQGQRLAKVNPTLLARLEAHFPPLAERGYRVFGLDLPLPSNGESPRQMCASMFGVIDGDSLVRLWGTFEDVTLQRQTEHERQALETQLRQVQRLESIGLLAGGVAHDFNNVLVAVLNYAELALRTLHTNPAAAAEDLRAIVKAAERAATLTRQLLVFSRQQPMQKQGINLNDLIRNLLKLLRRVIHESVDLDFVPGHALGTILGDPGQLEQVLLNLVVNANDAIEDVGRITIETENVVLNGSYIKTHPWARPGRYVLLSVSDTGAGMSDDVRERAFEPFFSTKPPERGGSGLGLSTAYGIVKQHDGMIHLYSEPGTGSRFKIYLPSVERAASAVGGRVEGMVRGGTETILVAEDNEMVRQVVCTLLERAGYTVLAARDGGEAVQIFDREKHAIGLALLDAVMPVMSGRAVFNHIHNVSPRLPVLFASGYTSGVFPEEFLREHQGRLLEKPYDSDTLLRRIREALDGSEKPAPPAL